MPIRITQRGNFDRTEKFLKFILGRKQYEYIRDAAQDGVVALASSTPVDSGVTASSWSYEIQWSSGGDVRIFWTNDHQNAGFHVVIGLQYGHGTGTGGYVVGRDFINPAMRPIFDEIADRVWREVQNA